MDDNFENSSTKLWVIVESNKFSINCGKIRDVKKSETWVSNF